MSIESTEDMKVETSKEEVSKEEIPTVRLHECSDGKHRNEKQYEAWKLKKAEFDKDPDNFCHMEDIVIGVVSDVRGRGCIFGKYPIEEIKAAMLTLQYRLFNELTTMDYRIQMKMAEKSLVGADGKPIGGEKPSGIIS